MIGKNEIGSFRRDLPTAEGHCPPPGLKRDNPPLGAADTSAGRQRTRQFWAERQRMYEGHGRPRPNEIGVAVKNGVVALTGWVDSYLKKWSTEEAAHRVAGVKAVANEIEIRLPASSERTDADIAVAAARGLEWDAGISC